MEQRSVARSWSHRLRSFARGKHVVRVVITMAFASRTLHAQATVSDFVPAAATNCAVTAPPATAGLFATPGGFVMVFPRNEGLTERYTGCKALWVVDVDRMLRLATLYFENGALTRAIAHDARDPKGGIEAACDLVAGRSLLPNAGRRLEDAGCKGTRGEKLYALRVPTWPRRCLTDPDAAVCKEDPR